MNDKIINFTDVPVPRKFTVLELIAYMNLPKDMIDSESDRPNLRQLMALVRHGKTILAYQFYEFFINRKLLFLTRAEIVTERRRRANKKYRQYYGNNWQGNTPKKQLYRKILIERDGKRCNHCKRADVFLEIDHIKKVADGGETKPYNLQLLCVKCHDEKDNQKRSTISNNASKRTTDEGHLVSSV
jgi:HNH endonuclease